jgi:hypothetical protein
MAGDSGKKKEIIDLPPVALTPSASAEQMAKALTKFSAELRGLAEDLERNGKQRTCRVRILIFDHKDPCKVHYHMFDCNGGGDGGGGDG